DPPPPIPTPLEPESRQRPKRMSAPPPPPPRSTTDLDEAPTTVGGTARDDPTDVTRSPLGDEVTGEIADEPGLARALDRRAAPGAVGPHPSDALRRAAKAAASSSAGVAAPVRPRVIAAAKPPNPAAEALRQSAAAGENYLNDLLTGGLLDVPGVRVPDSQ